MIKHAEGRRFLHKENNTFEAMQKEVSVTQKSTEVELWGVSLEIAGGEKYRSCNRKKRKTTRGSALPKPELSNCIHSWTLTRCSTSLTWNVHKNGCSESLRGGGVQDT